MKKKMIGLVLAGLLGVSAVTPITALADAQKVVTLGADLTEEQRSAVLRYFGIQGQNVQTLYITNQDERNHLASYVPIEQIGTRTFSCALVNPTNSGGIQVKTANLNWVTGNMIASTLSTCGVVNCEVLAAAPFEVSGTGALTGIIMAYEDASGTSLDATKKDIATQELVTTGTIANTVGQTDATNIVNEIKIQVIEGEVVDPQQVEEIVNEVVATESTVQLSQADRDLLTDLANRIAEQQYSYEDVKDTLERVEQNVNVNVNVETPAVNVTVNNDNSSSSDNTNTNTSNNDNSSEVAVDNASSSTDNSESILNDVDESAFGYEVITTTTDQVSPEVSEVIGVTTPETEAPAVTVTTEEDPFQIYSENTETFGGESTDAQSTTPDVSLDNPEGDVYTEPAAVDSEPAAVEEPAASVEEPAAPADEQPGETPVQEPAVTVAELTFDESNVKVLPGSDENAAGANVLRIRVQGSDLQPVAGEDGSFGTIVIDGASQIQLADPADPTKVNEALVAVRDTDDQAAFDAGWSAGGTDLYIALGSALQFADQFSHSVEIRSLTLASKAEDGTVTAKGTLNKTFNVYADQVGLTFDDIYDIDDLTEGSSVSGHLLLPEDVNEEGAYVYTGLIDEDYNIFFELGEDGRSFTADLISAGDSYVTVHLFAGGEDVGSYTFVIPVIPAE